MLEVRVHGPQIKSCFSGAVLLKTSLNSYTSMSFFPHVNTAWLDSGYILKVEPT